MFHPRSQRPLPKRARAIQKHTPPTGVDIKPAPSIAGKVCVMSLDTAAIELGHAEDNRHRASPPAFSQRSQEVHPQRMGHEAKVSFLT